jgi:hypothetical protein
MSNPPPKPYHERKAPLPSEVAFSALSPRAKETLKKIAIPISLGLSYKEVAAQLTVLSPTGTRPCTENHVANRMKQLREEILAQVERDGRGS